MSLGCVGLGKDRLAGGPRPLGPRVLGLALCVLVAACGQAPDPAEMFHTMSLRVQGAGLDGAVTQDDLEAEAVAMIGGAKDRVWVALEDFESEPIADALIQAQARGVEVKVVGDEDHIDQAGFARLLERDGGLKPLEQPVFCGEPAADGGPTVTRRSVCLGDGALAYSPAPNSAIRREGDQNRMTHNLVVVDGRDVLNLSGGFWAGDEDRFQVGVRATGQDIGRDFEDEVNQMYGGVFATTLSAFNGPLKSDTNNRVWYPTNEGALEVYFGPQERLVKRVIDEVYSARASVFIVAEELTNGYLADALRYKAVNGFKVGVVVDVDGARVPFTETNNLADTFAGLREGDDVLPDLRQARGLKQTVIILDSDASPINGKRYRTRVLVLSQPLLESFSFASTGAQTTPRAADPFTDGNLWVISRTPDTADPAIARNVDRFVKDFEAVFNDAEPVSEP